MSLEIFQFPHMLCTQEIFVKEFNLLHSQLKTFFSCNPELQKKINIDFDYLKNYNTTSYYTLCEISRYLEWDELLEEYLEGDNIAEELLFDKISKSPHDAIFFKYQAKGTESAFQACVDDLRSKVKDLTKRITSNWNKGEEREELGDFEDKRINLQLGVYFDGKKIISLRSHHGIFLHPSISNLQEDRILNSLNELNSLDLLDEILLFTGFIIPENEASIVSFSSADLPGISHINLYNRDDTDLLDDLLHENTHHLCNHFIKVYDPIEEEHEGKVFSPWRNSPRPLRGVFHAVFTFYSAYRLFLKLFTRDSSSSKISSRLIEEYYYLKYSCQELLKTKNFLKLSGKSFLIDLAKNLDRDRPIIIQAEAQLKKSHKTLFNKIKKQIQERCPEST